MFEFTKCKVCKSLLEEHLTNYESNGKTLLPRVYVVREEIYFMQAPALRAQRDWYYLEGVIYPIECVTIEEAYDYMGGRDFREIAEQVNREMNLTGEVFEDEVLIPM